MLFVCVNVLHNENVLRILQINLKKQLSIINLYIEFFNRIIKKSRWEIFFFLLFATRNKSQKHFKSLFSKLKNSDKFMG